MTAVGTRIPDREVGDRLRIAREARGLTQAEASRIIGAARTTLVAIEQGKRRIQLGELQKLAAAYRTSANAILRRGAVHLDIVPRFRKLARSADDTVARTSQLMSDLVSAELELENALGIARERRYPPERPLLPGELYTQAEQAAQYVRDWLGVGPGAIRDMVSLLELEMGLRVYVRTLDSTISGLFAYDDTVGACIMLNAAHPYERIAQSAAHELAHFIATRRQPEVLLEKEAFRSRDEQFANIFQRCFLTPGREVRQRFADLTAGQSHMTRRHVILLANSFAVSREAMVRRLEELGLARKGTWDWFMSNGGITANDVVATLGSRPSRPSYADLAEGLVPPRIAILARESWRNGLFSEAQLARMLQLDILGVRQVLDSAVDRESEAEDIVRLR